MPNKKGSVKKNSSVTQSAKKSSIKKTKMYKVRPKMYKIRVIMSNGESFETYSAAGRADKIIDFFASWDKYNHKAWKGLASSDSVNNDSSFSKRHPGFSIKKIVGKKSS